MDETIPKLPFLPEAYHYAIAAVAARSAQLDHMTRRLREALGLIFVLSMICGQVHARDMDMDMVDFERNLAAGGAAATFANDYVSGIQDGISWANQKAKDRYGQYLFCQPGDLALTDDQTIDMMRRYVAKHPTYKADFRVGLILMNALVEVFPCPK